MRVPGYKRAAGSPYVVILEYFMCYKKMCFIWVLLRLGWSGQCAVSCYALYIVSGILSEQSMFSSNIRYLSYLGV